MADIAAVFHWSSEAMDGMPLGELMRWHGKAVDRLKALNGVS